MHQGDAAAEDHAGAQSPSGGALFGGQGEGHAGAEDREQEGGDRAGQLIAAPHRRVVGQQGDEVGGPDTDAGDQRRQHDAQQPCALGASLGVGEKSEGGQGGSDADARRDQNEAQVMLTHNAREHFEHVTQLPIRPQCSSYSLTMKISFTC